MARVIYIIIIVTILISGIVFLSKNRNVIQETEEEIGTVKIGKAMVIDIPYTEFKCIGDEVLTATKVIVDRREACMFSYSESKNGFINIRDYYLIQYADKAVLVDIDVMLPDCQLIKDNFPSNSELINECNEFLNIDRLKYLDNIINNL